MPSQRYERVNAQDEDDHVSSNNLNADIPNSPPPSFRSRASSPTSHALLHSDDPLSHEAEQNLADAFDDGESSDGEDEADDRQRLMRGQPEPRIEDEEVVHGEGQGTSSGQTRTRVHRTMTELPVFTPPGTARASRPVNDGVFANLAAKPERGEKVDDKPPTYEQAAADATPPYWETTILAPGMSSDEVYVDGLPVGSVFSFVWNAMISMSFQLVGFLLTYLLHTTHAAKNGSRAGLGLTLVQYGFYMKGNGEGMGGGSPGSGDSGSVGTPADPNSHDFNPDTISDGATAAAAAAAGAPDTSDGIAAIASSEWLSYILMIVGWFILIRAVSDFLRARKHEQLVLQSPERGLNVPIIAEGESTERVV